MKNKKFEYTMLGICILLLSYGLWVTSLPLSIKLSLSLSITAIAAATAAIIDSDI